MNFSLRAVFAATLSIVAGTMCLAKNIEMSSEMLEQCQDIANCPIPYVRLSNQETDPFLFFGTIMDESHPRWRQYRRYLFKFTEVRGCLTKKEQEKVEPNLSLIDWQNVGTGRGADVCIFRIVSSLGTPERAKRWLELQGFETRPLQRLGHEREKHRYESQPWFLISGNWSVEQYREVNPNWFLELFDIDPVYTYSVTLNFSKDKSIVGVFASVIVE